MARRRPRILLPLLALVLLPSAAGAQGIAPPGNSAVDQYVESVPSADGPRKGGAAAAPDAGGPAAPVPSAAKRSLAAAGADGAAILESAGSGSDGKAAAPKGKAKRPAGRPSRSRAGAAQIQTAAADAPSVPSALLDAVASPGAGGLGVLLPALLAATLVAGLGLLLGRRMRR